MAKYRVLQISKNCFQPQWRGLFFWNGWGMPPYTPLRTFDTREEAEKFIEKYIDEHEREKYPKVVASWG